MTTPDNKGDSAQSNDAPSSSSDTEVIRKLVVPSSEPKPKSSDPRTPGNTDRDAISPDTPVTEEVIRKLVVPTEQTESDS